MAPDGVSRSRPESACTEDPGSSGKKIEKIRNFLKSLELAPIIGRCFASRPITAYYKFSFSSPEPHGGGRSGTLLGVGYVLDIAV